VEGQRSGAGAANKRACTNWVALGGATAGSSTWIIAWWGVTVTPGMRCMMRSAATSALERPTSAILWAQGRGRGQQGSMAGGEVLAGPEWAGRGRRSRNMSRQQ
jgi:hypothetical protein